MAVQLDVSDDPEVGSRDPGNEGTVRVLIADAHPLMRRNLRLLLDAEGEIEVIAEAEDLAAVIDEVHRTLPGVLVLALHMPDGSSMDAIRVLREQVPSTQIVVVTMDDSPGLAQSVLDAGAVGFVLKDRADTDMAAAVLSAADGAEYVSPRVQATCTRR